MKLQLELDALEATLIETDERSDSPQKAEKLNAPAPIAADLIDGHSGMQSLKGKKLNDNSPELSNGS